MHRVELNCAVFCLETTKKSKQQNIYITKYFSFKFAQIPPSGGFTIELNGLKARASEIRLDRGLLIIVGEGGEGWRSN